MRPFSFHDVERPLGAGEGDAPADLEVPPEGPLEVLPGVPFEDVLARHQQALHLGIRLGDEFDEQGTASPGEEPRGHLQGDVVPDGQVVDEGEGEDGVGRAALEEAHPFPVLPARGRARVGQVHEEREDPGFPSGPGREIVLLDAGGIDIERDRHGPGFRGDPAEGPDVPAQVPDRPRPDVGDEVLDGLPLVGHAFGRIVRIVVIVGPLRPRRPPAELPRPGLEGVDQSQEGPAAHRPAGHGRFAALVPLLAPGMKMDVKEQRRPPFRTGGQEGGGQIEGDAVQVDPQQLGQPDVPKAHQRERGQEMLAILAVGRPGLAFDGPAQGQGVDEDGPAPQELDVVGAGVDQRHAAAKSALLDIERGQGRVLELAEAPLVGIGDERDLLGADQLGDVLAALDERRHLFVRHEKARGRELFIKPRGHEVVIMGAAGRPYRPMEDAVDAEDEARGVAERGRKGALRTHRGRYPPWKKRSS